MSSFDFRQLKAFITVVDTGSFSSAAEQLKQSQSAISQHIQNLEQCMDCMLLDRKKRPVKPTLIGAKLYDEGIKLLVQAKLLQERVQAVKNGKLNLINVGMVDSVLGLTGISLLEYFKTKAYKVNQITGTAPNLLSSLQSGKVDIIISITNQDTPHELDVYPILSEQFVCLIPHDWKNNDIVSLCRDKDYIQYENGTPTGNQTNNWLRWRKLSAESQFSVTRAETVIEMVAKGYGWSLATPTFLAQNVDHIDAIECFPLPAPGLKRDLAVLCRKGEMGNFMDEMVEQIRIIIANHKMDLVLNKWPWLKG